MAFASLNDEQLQKTLMLAGLAVLAACVFALAWNQSRASTLWKEIDEYRSVQSDFRDWLREHRPDLDA